MILVTGGSGMIGRALVDQLLSQKKRVRVQVRDRIAYRQSLSCVDPLLEIVEADFSKLANADLRRMVADCETIVHCAALVHKPNSPYSDYELLNVRATQELAEAAAVAATKSFVFLSTIAVYGDGAFENVSEDSKPAPVTPYAVSKRQSEIWLQSFNSFQRTIILRPSMVFGEGDRGQLLKLIKQINKGMYFNIGPSPAYKSLIYSKDLCKAIDLSLQSLSAGFHCFNVSNPQPVSLWELTDVIANALGKKGGFIKVPKNVLQRAAGVAQSLLKDKSPVTAEQIEKLTATNTCSVEKLQKHTGFTPDYKLEHAIAAEIAWAKEVASCLG